MSAFSFRSGTLTVQTFVPAAADVIPTMGSTTLVCTSEALPANAIFNDTDSYQTLTAGTYNVYAALVGQDAVNKGYTYSISTAATSVVVASGNQIKVNVTNADLPSGFANAMCAVLFLQVGSGPLYQWGFTQIDPNPANDFTAIIATNPIPGCPQFAAATITDGLGAPVGGTWYTYGPTTEGTIEDFQFVNVTYKPDTGMDFPAPAIKAMAIEFQTEPNDIPNVIQATYGNYSTTTDSNGNAVEITQTMLQRAAAQIVGNNAIRLIFPPNVQGLTEYKLLLGNLTSNVDAFQMRWTKTDQVPVKFRMVPAPTDALLVNQHTVTSYRIA